MCLFSISNSFLPKPESVQGTHNWCKEHTHSSHLMENDLFACCGGGPCCLVGARYWTNVLCIFFMRRDCEKKCADESGPPIDTLQLSQRTGAAQNGRGAGEQRSGQTQGHSVQESWEPSGGRHPKRSNSQVNPFETVLQKKVQDTSEIRRRQPLQRQAAKFPGYRTDTNNIREHTLDLVLEHWSELRAMRTGPQILTYECSSDCRQHHVEQGWNTFQYLVDDTVTNFINLLNFVSFLDTFASKLFPFQAKLQSGSISPSDRIWKMHSISDVECVA